MDSSNSEECRKILRRMELEAYAAVVSTLRAQGELNKDRRKLLEDLSVVMKISPERHKAEVRRAVNDEKLSCIAERLSGGSDTEWGWALEGRRVVPLMPRLVRPTHFTALATTVSKTVSRNPKICLAPERTQNSNEAVPSRYVRDPDDEDTLSPVMVPIASPDSSCHSNNNFESDFVDAPHGTVEKKPAEPVSKKQPIIQQQHPPNVTKRPRSPSDQVVTVPSPMAKVRALSPSCVRAQQQNKPAVTTQPSPQHQQQLAPRGLVTAAVRPANVQHITSPVSSVPGRIRIRAPVHQGVVHRPVITSRPAVPQNTQIQLNQSRPTTPAQGTTTVKTVVQGKSSPVSQQQQQNSSLNKEVVIARAVLPTTGQSPQNPAAPKDPVRTLQHNPVAMQAVASTIAKSLPGKANVIVLHKNSPMAKTLTATREGDRSGAAMQKTNFLPKTVCTSTGAKMTLPGNVRIISVPTGTNLIGSSPGGLTGINHTAGLAQKITSAGTGVATPKSVYVLELSNEAAGAKSIVLSDISQVAELNGVASKTITVKQEAKLPANNSGVPANNGVIEPASNPDSLRLSCEVNYPAKGIEKGHVVVKTLPHHDESTGAAKIKTEAGLVDPETGIVKCADDGETQGADENPSLGIFHSTIASTDLNLDATTASHTFNSDDSAGGTRLILTDANANPAKS